MKVKFVFRRPGEYDREQKQSGGVQSPGKSAENTKQKGKGSIVAKKSRSGSSFTELHNELERQIREQDFRRVYMICGGQDYLRSRFRDELRNAVTGPEDQMNTALFTGNEFCLPEVADLLQTMPFLAPRRLVILENSWVFGKGGDTDPLLKALETIPDFCTLVFVEPAPNKTTALYKRIAKLGFVMDCSAPEEGVIRDFARKEFADAGMSISGPVLAGFLKRTGTDMLNIQSEAGKLISYCGDRKEVTGADVEAVCSVVVQDRIFDMISAIARTDRKEALHIYMDLIRLQTPPQVILSLMIRQFNQLLQIGELMQRRTPPGEIASILHINPWVLENRLQPCLRGYTQRGLIHALQDCVQADTDYKRGRIDARLAVEKLIVVYSGTKF